MTWWKDTNGKLEKLPMTVGKGPVVHQCANEQVACIYKSGTLYVWGQCSCLEALLTWHKSLGEFLSLSICQPLINWKAKPLKSSLYGLAIFLFANSYPTYNPFLNPEGM